MEDMSSMFRQNLWYVPSGPDGRPDPPQDLIKEAGIYITKNVRDVFEEWIFDSGNSEFVKIGNITDMPDEETELRKERVENVRQYFETKKRKEKLTADLESVSDIVDAVTVALEDL